MGKVLAHDVDNGHSTIVNDNPAAAPLAVSDDLIDNLGKLFKLLSDETRLRILCYLTQCDELHVRALCELLHESQPAVSHHLALLRMAGLIGRRRSRCRCRQRRG